MTRPLDPRRKAVRDLLKEARKEGLTWTKAWVYQDGKTVLGFAKGVDLGLNHEIEGAPEADTWSDVA